jgi:hypothetical protein
MILLNTTACNPGWKRQQGAQILPEVYLYNSPDLETPPTATSSRVTFTLPDGWHWVMRGDDFIATRNGVFLQNISVERIHVGRVEQSDGMFPLAALSSKQWPFRTVKYLKKRFAPGMSPTDAAGVVLASRANNPGVADLDIREVIMQTVAGYQGFKAVYDFRLDVQGRKTPYRTLSYGFMRDEWFYGISYTAAKRYYFQKDAEAFESVLRSFRLVEK